MSQRLPAGLGAQLARCIGFAVQDDEGLPLGTVAWVRYGSRVDCPDVLVVRRRGVLGGRGRVEIPTDHVTRVDPGARTVTLAG